MSIFQIERTRVSNLRNVDFRRFVGKLVTVRVWASPGNLIGDAMGTLAGTIVRPVGSDAKEIVIYLAHMGPLVVKFYDELELTEVRD